MHGNCGVPVDGAYVSQYHSASKPRAVRQARAPRIEEVDRMKYSRITIDPDQMGGAPCIRGLRIPVSTVVGMVAEGMAEAEILHAYPDLSTEDIREALRYAAEAVRERELPLVATP